MFFKIDTEKSAVLRQAADDAKKLRNLEAELSSLKPEWTRLEEELERTSAAYDGMDRGFSHARYEPWWEERTAALKSRIVELVQERDSLVGPVVKEIQELKDKLHRRQSILGGGFCSWADTIRGQLSAPMAAEIAQARAEVAKTEDIGAILDITERWIARASELDENAMSVPLLNLPKLLKQAAALE